MNQPRVVAMKAVWRQEPRVPILERPCVTEIPYKKGNKKVPRKPKVRERMGKFGQNPGVPLTKV